MIYATPVLARSLPAEGAPLPFASTAMDGGSLLIGLTPTDEGQIFWQPTPDRAPVKVAEDLASFLAALYKERPVDG